MMKEEQIKLIVKKPSKDRIKMKFLQKYYHKGSFFQDNADDKLKSRIVSIDEINQRKYWTHTAEDNFDKTLLPVVMQVKDFGRRGRTKWTHLVSEDTCERDHMPFMLTSSKHFFH